MMPSSQNRMSTRLTSMKVSKRFLVNSPFVVFYLVCAIPISASISFTPDSTSPAMKHTTITFFRVVDTPNSSARPLDDHVSRHVPTPIRAISSVRKVSVVLGNWMSMTMGQTMRPGLLTKRWTQKKGMVRIIIESSRQAGMMAMQYWQSMVLVGHFTDSCMLAAPKIIIMTDPTMLRVQMARKPVLGWCGLNLMQSMARRLTTAMAMPTPRMSSKYWSRQLVYMRVTKKVAQRERASWKKRSSTLKALLLAWFTSLFIAVRLCLQFQSSTQTNYPEPQTQYTGVVKRNRYEGWRVAVVRWRLGWAWGQ